MPRRNQMGGEIELTTLDTIWEEGSEHETDEATLLHGGRFDDLDDVRRSWLLRPVENTTRYVDIGCMKCSPKAFRVYLCLVFFTVCLIGVPVIVKMAVPKHKYVPPPPDNFTVALHKALLFFNAQKSGRLPKNNGIPWRGNSGLEDGLNITNLQGGYYDGGNNIKYNFPLSFAMSMLSWSVLEYEHKFRSTGEYDHVRDLIKWGTDYLLLTFDSNASRIDTIYSQVGWRGDASAEENDEQCWERPEDMDYARPIRKITSAPDLAGEMAASLAAASIVFKDDNVYSMRLIKSAQTLFSFARDSGKRHPYSWNPFGNDASYHSTGYWDEHVWGATWLFYATGDINYLTLATSPRLVKNAKAASPIPSLRVLSWDNKLPAAMVLLTRLRIFLSPGYPYEEILADYHKTIEKTMCSYLRRYHAFNFTRGGLMELNRGERQPLQYVVNSGFLASLYADYMNASGAPEWLCGDTFLPLHTLKQFATSQIEYILGSNPMNMSYIVGYGTKFPRHVHHRGASIPNDGNKYSCMGGIQWRDNPSPNPNIIIGAMVGGPDKFDNFSDARGSSTEPTMAGNAGLVAALVSLTETGGSRIDRNNIFSSIQSLG